MFKKIVQPSIEIGASSALVVGFSQLSTALGWISAGVLGLVFAWRLA